MDARGGRVIVAARPQRPAPATGARFFAPCSARSAANAPATDSSQAGKTPFFDPPKNNLATRRDARRTTA